MYQRSIRSNLLVNPTWRQNFPGKLHLHTFLRHLRPCNLTKKLTRIEQEYHPHITKVRRQENDTLVVELLLIYAQTVNF